MTSTESHFTVRPATVAPTPAAVPASFELRFESLFNPGRGLAFPCDARGCVELDALSEPARRNYFYARAVVGREFATPAVVHGAAAASACQRVTHAAA